MFPDVFICSSGTNPDVLSVQINALCLTASPPQTLRGLYYGQKKKKKSIMQLEATHVQVGVCGWFLKKPKMFANACNTVWSSDELLMICAISCYAKEAKVTRFYCILDGKAQCYCCFLLRRCPFSFVLPTILISAPFISFFFAESMYI